MVGKKLAPLACRFKHHRVRKTFWEKACETCTLPNLQHSAPLAQIAPQNDRPGRTWCVFSLKEMAWLLLKIAPWEGFWVQQWATIGGNGFMGKLKSWDQKDGQVEITSGCLDLTKQAWLWSSCC